LWRRPRLKMSCEAKERIIIIIIIIIIIRRRRRRRRRRNGLAFRYELFVSN
jgi:hypothetical protein